MPIRNLTYNDDVEEQLIKMVKTNIESLTGFSDKYEVDTVELDDQTLGILVAAADPEISMIFGSESRNIKALTHLIQISFPRYKRHALIVVAGSIDEADDKIDEVYRKSRRSYRRRSRCRSSCSCRCTAGSGS